MTLKTWKAEFYPKEAKARMSKKSAIEHSIQKWIGLRKENLEAHGLVADSHQVLIYEDIDSDRLRIDSRSCALCHKYALMQEDECEKCPLYLYLGGRCDSVETPYFVWRRTGDPEPMIDALQEARKLC